MNYKIGAIMNSVDSSVVMAHCNCGDVSVIKNGEGGHVTHTCASCGNTDYVDLRLSVNNRVVIPYLNVLSKDDKSFNVERVNLTVFVEKKDNKYKLKIKENTKRSLYVNFVSREISTTKNGKYSPKKSDIGYFFRGLDDYSFIKLVSTDKNAELLNFINKNLTAPDNNYYRYKKQLYRGILKYLKDDTYKYIQILSSAGYKNLNRLYERRYSWRHNDTYTINVEGKNPQEIFKLPKFVLKYIKNSNDTQSLALIKLLQEASRNIEGNKLKNILEIAKDESTISELLRAIDGIIELHSRYGYNNINRLTLYLLREIKMNQGIIFPHEGVSLLIDYVKMSTDMGYEYEKYPKSLKKEHDIVAMNYRVRKDEIKKQKFKESVATSEYKNLEYSNDVFCIVSPSDIEDLINEGSELSHCVASYTNDIINGNCKILFIRDRVNLNKPLATVEVRNDNVRQARGFGNRKVTKKEAEFIDEWAKEKELILNYY